MWYDGNPDAIAAAKQAVVSPAAPSAVRVHVLGAGVNQENILEEWLAYYTQVVRAESVQYVHNRGLMKDDVEPDRAASLCRKRGARYVPFDDHVGIVPTMPRKLQFQSVVVAERLEELQRGSANEEWLLYVDIDEFVHVPGTTSFNESSGLMPPRFALLFALLFAPLLALRSAISFALCSAICSSLCSAMGSSISKRFSASWQPQ